MTPLRKTVRLPDLEDRTGFGVVPKPATGWFALGAHPNVSVPTLEQARRCARVPGSELDACEARVIAFDPPTGIAIVDLGPDGVLVFTAQITPAFPVEQTPELVIRATSGDFEQTVTGEVLGACRDRLRFVWEVPDELGDATFEVFVVGFERDSVTIGLFLDAPPPPTDRPDPCAITLTPGTRRAGISVESAPSEFPAPPLLTVDASGCVLEAWSVSERGLVLVPKAANRVDLQLSCRGGIIASIELEPSIRDAIFWPGLAGGSEVIAVLTPTEVHLFDLQGCPVSPSPLVTGLDDAIALGLTEEGFLLVIQRGTGNVHVFRRDGSEVQAPASFDGRGFYARHRNASIVFDLELCAYLLDPSKAGDGCCVGERRPLTDEESLFFRLIDDLSDLRRRVAFPASGAVIIGPAEPEDPLDAGRPGTQWHRILVFGEIPEGCAIRIETRAFDDIVGGDPLVPDGWSEPVLLASPSSAVPVRSPGDTRTATADALVLASPGRFLWMRLTLLSNGRATPRITELELELPRIGIGRFLPEVFQNSTPADDFLRRWLALFENTAFDGVAQRMDEYAELFDPRTAPELMLPFLAEWLQILDLARLRANPNAFRRVLARAAELARTRGTVDGLRLAIRLYLEIDALIVENFKRRSGFILGCGTTIDDLTGPVLGCQTALSAEPPPTVLGDEPRLGCSFLLDCDDRTGTTAHHFDVLVPARKLCSDEDLALLELVVETEKPAHTTFAIKPTGGAGWVLGVQSILGQEIREDFDRNKLEPETYGFALLNGPGRPKPIGFGFALGHDSRLSAAEGQPGFRLNARVGSITLGA